MKWRSLRLPEINRRTLQLNPINRQIVRTEILTWTSQIRSVELRRRAISRALTAWRNVAQAVDDEIEQTLRLHPPARSTRDQRGPGRRGQHVVRGHVRTH